MRIFYLSKKELLEIFRQKEMLAIMFIAPLIQTIILGYVVTTDVKHIPVEIVDLSQSKATSRISHRIQSSPLFDVKKIAYTPEDYLTQFKKGYVKSVIIFRDNLKKDSGPFTAPEIQILLDGVDANSSLIAAGYFNGVIRKYVLEEFKRYGVELPVENKTLIRFNPDLKSINYMGPAIVALLLLIITMFLISSGLVREKEQQTLDTLMISRLSPFEIYMGKSIPMALLGLLEMFFGIVVVLLFFKVSLKGNILYLLLAALIFLLAVLAYALLISTVSSTQQQALFFSWFSMVLFLLLSGLFTPIENIPKAFRWLADINPLRYFIKIIREIFLKGNGIAYFYRDLLIIAAITIVVLIISMVTFRRTVQA